MHATSCRHQERMRWRTDHSWFLILTFRTRRCSTPYIQSTIVEAVYGLLMSHMLLLGQTKAMCCYSSFTANKHSETVDTPYLVAIIWRIENMHFFCQLIVKCEQSLVHFQRRPCAESKQPWFIDWCTTLLVHHKYVTAEGCFRSLSPSGS